MKYAVNSDGIKAMRTMAAAITNAISVLEAETNKVENIAAAYPDALGPHKASLDRALQDISQSLKYATEPAAEVAENLEDVAEGYEDIIEHDGIAASTGNSAGAGLAGAVMGAAAAGSSMTASAGASASKQTEHKPIVHEDNAINAVIDDIRAGSGKIITKEHAEEIYGSIQSYTYDEYSAIRHAYNNPNADMRDVKNLQNVDEYLNNAPKWEGQVFRGINVSKKVLNEILSKEPIDMLGPSSWSSIEDVADEFASMYDGEKGERVVFVLPENRSGVSVTHISQYNGREGEVTAPSGVKYGLDFVEEVKKGNDEFVYVYVHELGD